MQNPLTSLRAVRWFALALLAFVGIGLAGCQSTGDKADEKSDRAARQAEGRVDQETDRAIDRGMDRLFN